MGKATTADKLMNVAATGLASAIILTSVLAIFWDPSLNHLEDTEFNPMLNSRFNRRGYGEELVGKRITVYCTEWENWYAADVLRWDPKNNAHELEYVLDGWQEVADLTNFHVKVVYGDDEDNYTHGEPPRKFAGHAGVTLLDAAMESTITSSISGMFLGESAPEPEYHRAHAGAKHIEDGVTA